jgi:signal transduction histidine kinase
VRPFRTHLHWAILWIVGVAGVWALVISTVWGNARARPFATFVVFALLFVASRKMARRLAAPIEAMTEATRRIGDGELSYRVQLPQRRGPRVVAEMHALGQSFNEMAERVERLVRGHKELLANVSHELRSPLARIRVALEMIPRTPENERRLAGLEEDLGELEELIDDVLTASRLDAQAAPARMETVAVDALLDGLVVRAAHDPQLAGKAIERRGAAGSITADPALVRRAIWNLIENAGKHGAPPITVAAERTADRVVITVADRGDGIPAGQRDEIFAPFARLDRARTTRGVGLGLTIARRAAEVHGGTLAVADGEHGFSMVFSIPA